MAIIQATRAAQWPLMAEFTINFDDQLLNPSGVLEGITTVGSHVFDAIKLPQGACVVGGEVVTETAFTGSTALNVSIGDATLATRYLGATDKTAATRTALVLTGFMTTGEDIRITIAPTVAAVTAGKLTVRVLFTLRNRANETMPN